MVDVVQGNQRTNTPQQEQNQETTETLSQATPEQAKSTVDGMTDQDIEKLKKQVEVMPVAQQHTLANTLVQKTGCPAIGQGRACLSKWRYHKCRREPWHTIFAARL